MNKSVITSAIIAGIFAGKVALANEPAATATPADGAVKPAEKASCKGKKGKKNKCNGKGMKAGNGCSGKGACGGKSHEPEAGADTKAAEPKPEGK